MEDNILVRAAAQGDQGAFTKLVEGYRNYIYTIAYKVTLNEEDALDITQDVFMKLVEKIGEFEGRGAFRSWLAALTVNTAITFLRRKNQRMEDLTEPLILEKKLEDQKVSFSNDPRATAEIREQRRLVEEAMGELSPQQRAIFALRLLEDLKPKEIAEHLGLPAGQVRSQLHRAILKIRRAIIGEDEKMKGRS